MDDDKVAMNFWGRVDIAQAEAGIPSLKKVCDDAGVYYQTMENKRTLGKLPNLVSAYAISKSVGRSVEWLMTGENTPDYGERKNTVDSILDDQRLSEIVKKLTTASSNELLAVEVILGIKK